MQHLAITLLRIYFTSLCIASAPLYATTHHCCHTQLDLTGTLLYRAIPPLDLTLPSPYPTPLYHYGTLLGCTMTLPYETPPAPHRTMPLLHSTLLHSARHHRYFTRLHFTMPTPCPTVLNQHFTKPAHDFTVPLRDWTGQYHYFTLRYSTTQPLYFSAPQHYRTRPYWACTPLN